MYEVIVPTLVFISVLAVGGAVVISRAARNRAMKARLQEWPAPNEGQSGEDSGSPWLRLLSRVGRTMTGGSASAGLRAELAAAGYYHRSAAAVYLAIKMLLAIAGITGLTIVLLPIEFLTMPAKLLLATCGTGILFFLPNIFVSRRRELRRRDIEQHLADVLDLLEICVSAGMGLDAAWNWIEDEMRGVTSPLADEMALTTLEMHLGASRAVAMRHMADRANVRDIAALVGVLAQSEQFGTSVSDALRTFAASMREVRSQRAEESAEKMPVKMLFPLILLIFPALLIVICGPSAIKWMAIMSY